MSESAPVKRSVRVADAAAALRQRLNSGLYRPGDRFMSNRAAAAQCGISYQTAHRVLNDLVAEGLLERRDRSGTYLPGRVERPASIELVMHPRARTPGSFGAKLLDTLRRELHGLRLGEVPVSYGMDARPGPDRLAILWEAAETLRGLIRHGRRAILVNDRPAPGLDNRLIDSVSTDDFAGGVVAAQYLSRTLDPGADCLVLAGPRHDPRSRARAAGFQSERSAEVIYCANWYAQAAALIAPQVLARRPAGVFCCNDRLAQGLIEVARRDRQMLPRLVGFDNAPVAERLNLTTIAIPWDAIAAAVSRLARERLAGQDHPATHLIYYPSLLLRG